MGNNEFIFTDIKNNYDSYISGEKNISPSDYELLINRLINKNIPIEGIQEQVINICLKGLATNEQLFDMTDKGKLYIEFAKLKSFEKVGLSDIEVVILYGMNLGNGCNGMYNSNTSKLLLSRSILEKNPIDACSTILHELTHQKQHYLTSDKGYLSAITMYDVMDTINRRKLGNKYYDENYFYISCEMEAELSGMSESLEYFNSLNVPIPEEIKGKFSNMTNSITNDIKTTQYLYRKVNGVDVPIGLIFAEAIYNNPEYLDEFPQIAMGYKEVDGHLVAKSLEELEMDYENYKNGNINWVGDPTEIDMLYQNTIIGLRMAMASSTETVLSELNKLQYITTNAIASEELAGQSR